MRNQGLVNFLHKKQVHVETALKMYAELHQLPKKQVEQHIQDNWVKFASWVHTSIVAGTLKGKPVKLDHYSKSYYTQKKADIQAKIEYEKENGIHELVEKLRKKDLSDLQSFCAKNGINVGSNPDKSFPTSSHTRFAFYFRDNPELLEQALNYTKCS